eukprot:TRINITY_DN2856_c6_g1_i1.p1 TRINITY_DN2856_c6_g1~~TRINITY_DN2856_c6_g1_i1.p1  ORF type:complete len:136 (+),score=12.76 TRINITY_DN2856_c6_g1_i1:46-408(+)
MMKYLYTERLTYGVGTGGLVVLGCALQLICFGMSLLIDFKTRELDVSCSSTGGDPAQATTRQQQLHDLYCRKSSIDMFHLEATHYRLSVTSNWCIILAIVCAFYAYRPNVYGASVNILRP